MASGDTPGKRKKRRPPSLAERPRTPSAALTRWWDPGPLRWMEPLARRPPASRPDDDLDLEDLDDGEPDDDATAPRSGQSTRRRVLVTGAVSVVGLAAVGAAVGGAVYEGWLPGRRRLIEKIEGCGPAAVPPTVTAGPVVSSTVHSSARGRQVRLVVAYPPGYEPGLTAQPGSPDAVGGAVPALPVCLVLHGRGDSARSLVDPLAAPAYLAAATAGGVAPFALVAVDGGETFWHRRASGDDPERMLFDEVLPALATQGLRTDRFAVLGWSMGGYGALLLARRHASRVVAAVASSPAVWHSFGRSAPGAFDSAADFDAHRVLGVGPGKGVLYRIDCGNADEFSPVSHTLARELGAQHHFTVGCHDFGAWRRALPDQLAFVSQALSAA